MKSSTKENKIDLIACPFCDWIFSKKYSSKHKHFCNADRPNANFAVSIPEKFCHGFVKNEVFFAGLDEIETPNELNQINASWLRENMCFVHPTIMKQCKMCLGDPVSVSSSKKTLISVVWSSTNVQLGSVSFLKKSLLNSTFKNEKLLRIDRITKVLSVKNLDLISTTTKTFTNTDEFRNFVRFYLKYAFVYENSNILLPYFGQVCVFRCTNLIGKAEEIDLETNFSNLSLNFNDSDVGFNEDSSFLNDSTSSRCSNSTDLNENFILLPENPTNIDRIYKISDDSDIKIVLETSFETKNQLKFDDLGGLKLAKQILHDHVLIPMKLLKNEKEFSLKNFKSRSILLYGPSGCGKTELVQALVNEENLNLIIFDPFKVDFESLTNEKTPCLVFLDDIDTFVYVRESSASNETTKKLQNNVCSLIDSIQKDDRLIFFIAATNKPERLDNFLRRRFDVEVEISVPNRVERKEILCKILNNFDHQLIGGDIEQLADKAHGFTPSDLLILCKEAGVKSSKRAFDDGASGKIEVQDLNSAFSSIRPSGMREIFLEVPKVLWADIGGQQDLKQQLKQAIEWPLKHPETFFRLGIKPPSGILMYGPPGCSKTMVAKALATESGLNFLAIKGPELFNKWVGESERAVREVFRKARQVSPSIVFFDEIDALAGERSTDSGSNVADRVLTQLLTELDGVQTLSNVVVVAATNRPDVIDRALLRPGRLDRLVYVPLPDNETREAIFKIQFRRIPVAADVDVGRLVAETEGFSGAELVVLCTEAALLSLQESLDSKDVKMVHFENSLKFVKPRTDKKSLKVYEEFSKSCLH